MHKISVIITTYNRKNLLKRAIKSVLAQTYSHYNIIIVDDGSTDNTSELQILNDPRITYISQTNQGTSAAKNTGIKESSAPFIAFLDSDDTWEKNKLAVQIKYMEENPSCKISYTEETWIRNGKFVNPKRIYHKAGGEIFDKTIQHCIIGISTIMIKRDLFEKIGTFDETLPVCEDYDLWIRIAAKHKIALIKQKLTNKFALPHPQLSFSNYPMEHYRLKALEKCLRTQKLSQQQYDLVLKSMKKKYTIMLKGTFKRKNIKSAISIYFKLISVKINFYSFFFKKVLSYYF